MNLPNINQENMPAPKLSMEEYVRFIELSLAMNAEKIADKAESECKDVIPFSLQNKCKKK